MFRQIVRKATRGPTRSRQFSAASRGRISSSICRAGLTSSRVICQHQPITTSSRCSQGMMDDASNHGKNAAPSKPTSYSPVDLSDSEYHDIADEYLDNVLTQFEALQDTREDLDIEFSSGVMTITHTEIGTYVINKQPPNKQIWLSSPISGPKRYDWCVVGDSQADKEDTASGDWIYSRDNSSLSALILEELGVNVSLPLHS